MSQNTGLHPMELDAGVPFVFPHDATKLEEEILQSIQDWHLVLRDKVLQLVLGNFPLPKSSNNVTNTGCSAAASTSSSSSLPPTFQPTVFCGGGSSHIPGHSRPPNQPVNFQFVDRFPAFVQRTVSFMLSELGYEWEQIRQRNFHQRNLMKKRYTYLVQCRLNAEKEKKAAQDLLLKAIAALQAAERERERCGNERIMALQDLRLSIRRRQSSLWVGSTVPRSVSTTSLVSSSASSLSSSRSDLLLVPANHKHCLLTPPRTPFEEHEPKSAGSVTETKLAPQDELPSTPSKQIEDSSFNGLNIPFQSAKGDTLQNPIGPYMRPPMSIEDMQKCIRCLFGKDKSLKTGNRARAFLGVPWSVIVSWDPEVLLQRGVCGIKPGSTGMASRLRMMTIIESALANQGNDAITEEIWERPTHFCERCQQRYPITVRSDERVQIPDNLEEELHQPSPSTVTDKLDIDKRGVRVRNKRSHRKKLYGSNA